MIAPRAERVVGRFALLLVLATVAAALEPTVTAEIPWGSAERYVPVLVQVHTPVAGRFEISAAMGTDRASTAIELPAGGARTLTLLLPASAQPSPDAVVTWTGPEGSGDRAFANCRTHQWCNLAVVDRDEAIPLARFASAKPGTTGYHPSGQPERVPLESLPQRWQGYPQAMTLLISAADDRVLDEERRGAIATWASTGGALAIAEPAQAPRWRALGVEPMVIGTGETTVLGAGETALRERLNRWAIESPPALHPVPGTERVPATGFALVALLFLLVVGPLNLWWARRRGNRHLLLLTTPALSLATCAILIVVNLAVEGIALRRSAVQVTWLDQRLARAVAWTGATYYGGFAVDRLTLDAEGCARVFSENGNQDWRSRRRWTDPLAIAWSDGQQHLEGWIPARLNRQLLFTEPRPERARLSVERVGDGWQVVNGLGRTIRRIQWRDPQQEWWMTTAVGAGASATLERVVGTDAEERLISTEMELTVGGRPLTIDRPAQDALESATAAAYGFVAALDGPFGDLPGPTAIDAEPLTCLVVGSATPAGATP